MALGLEQVLRKPAHGKIARKMKDLSREQTHRKIETIRPATGYNRMSSVNNKATRGHTRCGKPQKSVQAAVQEQGGGPALTVKTSTPCAYTGTFIRRRLQKQ